MSKMRKLVIANCCYANVAGRFADFCVTANRGENFTWQWFIDSVQRDSSGWIKMHLPKPSSTDKEFASACAKEIAETLVHRLLG